VSYFLIRYILTEC